MNKIHYFDMKGINEMSNPPAHIIRFGLIKGSIWRNQTRAGERFTVTVVRLFKNGDHWTESTRFGRDDLPLVAKVCDLAHTWVFDHSGSRAVESNQSQAQGATDHGQAE